MHYTRLRKHGDPTIKRSKKVEAPCSVAGCHRPYSAKGYCKGHYKRVLDTGDPHADIPLGRRGTRLDGTPSHQGVPIGTRRVDSNSGYVWVKSPQAVGHKGWILEHRLVMSEILGRPLYADEIVHHKDGDRTNNDPSNLELCVKRQPPGQRVVDLLPWARELVERYDGRLFQ